ncbi:MAG: ABC transporter substrate-binding protein [Oscillospiraceae bacterium]|jgi:ABC-type oligopeptide transport system substrate-binding subunit|nr:ABC transporter substrate-binding protein [Oscillospiraceae bacterium]
MKVTNLKSRLFVTLIALILLAASVPVTGASATSDGAKVYHTSMTAECPTLNGQNNVDIALETPFLYCGSPLFRRYPTENGLGYVWIGDLASELPIKIDDYTWQIKLRPEAQWQNGDPINADTIMYSWKMLLDPILINSMSDFLSDQSIKIVNAREYSLQGTSNTIAWEDVGIKKIDDYTIELKTIDTNSVNDVCSHFTDRSTYPVYEPYYEAGMNESRTETTYGTTLDNWMGSGPYTFKTWEYGSIHVYEKNPDHWLSDLFNWDSVEVRIVPEMNARVELWEKGLLDYMTPNSSVIETYIDDPRLVTYDSLTVYHIDVNDRNPNNPISGTVEYRKALYHAINRQVVANDIFGYMIPTGTYINGQAGLLSESGLTYRESEQGKAVTALVESWGPSGYNPELAREYLAKAYEAAGIPEDTVITVIFATESDNTAWLATAEYLMEQWPVIFEGKVKLELVTYAGMGAGDWKSTGDDKWDLSPNDWTRSVSRNYPYSAFYYYLSSYSSSPNNYHVDAFDAQYAIADAPELKSDYNAMLDETKKLEEIYLDYVIHIPVVQHVNYEMFSERMALPVKTYIPGFGWGNIYADLTE